MEARVMTFVAHCTQSYVTLSFHQVSFKQQFNQGAISDYPAGEVRKGFVDVQCFPLFTFLLAINRTTIDYLSLDVEGGELDVLYTVPFHRVNIKVSIR